MTARDGKETATERRKIRMQFEVVAVVAAMLLPAALIVFVVVLNATHRPRPASPPVPAAVAADTGWMSGWATVYDTTSDALNGGGRLARGYGRPQFGLCAADPRWPFGTVFEIRYPWGATEIDTVADRGGAVRDRGDTVEVDCARPGCTHRLGGHLLYRGPVWVRVLQSNSREEN